MSIERCMTIQQVATRLARSERAVRNLMAEKGSTFPRPFTLTKGGDPVFDMNDLDVWIDARKIASAVESGETAAVKSAVKKLFSKAG